jgi:hypothetical protein
MAKSISGILIAISIGVLVGTHAALAQESLTLRVVSFGHTNVFTDGGTGFINTGSLTSGNWVFPSGITAYSQPFQGDATHDSIVIDVPTLQGSNNAPNLYITATETGFTPFPTPNGTAALTFSNTMPVAGILTGMVNNTVIGRLNSTSITNILVTNNVLTNTFSMTESISFAFSGPQSVSGSGYGELSLVAVPEPSTAALVIAAAMLGCVVRRRRRSNPAYSD